MAAIDESRNRRDERLRQHQSEFCRNRSAFIRPVLSLCFQDDWQVGFFKFEIFIFYFPLGNQSIWMLKVFLPTKLNKLPMILQPSLWFVTWAMDSNVISGLEKIMEWMSPSNSMKSSPLNTLYSMKQSRYGAIHKLRGMLIFWHPFFIFFVMPLKYPCLPAVVAWW